MCTTGADTRSPENYNATALGCDFNFCWYFCTQVVTSFLRLLSLWDSVTCISEFAWMSMGILIIPQLLIGTDVKWGTIVCLKMSIQYSLWEWSILYTKIHQLQGNWGRLKGAKVQAGAGTCKGMAKPGHRQTCSHLGVRNSDAQQFRISEHWRTLTDPALMVWLLVALTKTNQGAESFILMRAWEMVGRLFISGSIPPVPKAILWGNRGKVSVRDRTPNLGKWCALESPLKCKWTGHSSCQCPLAPRECSFLQWAHSYS